MVVDENARVHIRMLDATTHDPRRYNRPTVHEIGGIIIGDELGDPHINPVRDIIIERLPNGDANRHRYQRISELNPSYFPLRYPFIFLYGEQGWHTSIPLAGVDLQRNPDLLAHRQAGFAVDADNDGDDDDSIQADEEDDGGGQTCRGVAGSIRVSQAQFYNFHLQRRQNFSPMQWAGRLLQEMIIDAWVCVEANRLQYQRSNQLRLRADLYSGLRDAMAGGMEENAERLGRQIVLASSFIGGPRHMRQQYQDAMAICRQFGKPDFFVTFTCNPQWPEILDALYPGQQPEDAPHIVSRVFHLKLHSLLNILTTKDVLGKLKAFVYVIEFQKRGLPHAHILLILEDGDKITSVEDIDNCISAELPDRDVDPELFNIVKTNMIHGPCTPDRCQVNGTCRKRYPRAWAEETIWNEDGYPTYRRRNDGRRVEVRNRVLDNRFVVPYNPYLSKRYNAHINVEVHHEFTI